jgi:hypothetical protein
LLQVFNFKLPCLHIFFTIFLFIILINFTIYWMARHSLIFISINLHFIINSYFHSQVDYSIVSFFYIIFYNVTISLNDYSIFLYFNYSYLKIAIYLNYCSFLAHYLLNHDKGSLISIKINLGIHNLIYILIYADLLP